MDLMTLWLFFVYTQYIVATFTYAIVCWHMLYEYRAIVRVVMTGVVIICWPLLLPYYAFGVVRDEIARRT